MQLQVRDVDEAIGMFKRAGGAVSRRRRDGGFARPRGATTKVAIVRDPNNLFVVLLQAAPQAPDPKRGRGSRAGPRALIRCSAGL